MIRTLRVRNLALIEELDLELGSGFHVFTGETGAGKSILLGAVAASNTRQACARLSNSMAVARRTSSFPSALKSNTSV